MQVNFIHITVIISALSSGCAMSGKMKTAYPITPKGEMIYQDLKNGSIYLKNFDAYWLKCPLGQKWDPKDNSCQGTPVMIQFCRELNACENGEGSEAVKSCNKLNSGTGFAGRKGWHLPSIEALKRLIHCTSGKPDFYPYKFRENPGCQGKFSIPTQALQFFPDAGPSYRIFGTSTLGDNSSMWLGVYTVNFEIGRWGFANQTDSFFVRCVSK